MDNRINDAYSYLITKDLGRRPMDEGVISVHSVDQESPASADVVDRIIRNFL